MPTCSPRCAGAATVTSGGSCDRNDAAIFCGSLPSVRRSEIESSVPCRPSNSCAQPMSIAAKCGFAFALVPRVRRRKPIVRRTVRPLNLPVHFVTGLELVGARQFLADRDCARPAQPLLEIELLRGLEISQLEGAKGLVGQDVDPKQIEIFSGKGRQGDDAPNDRSRGGHAFFPGDGGKKFVPQGPGRSPDLELRLARDDVDARFETRGSRCGSRSGSRDKGPPRARRWRRSRSRATGAARDSAGRASERGEDIAGSKLRWLAGRAAR